MMAAACVAASTCTARPNPDADAGVVRVGVVAPREGGPSGVAGLQYLTGALVNETLVSIGTNGEIVPRLIERWERSADGRTWRFHLKKGVRFHNGAPLTSEVILPALKTSLGALIGAREVSRVDDLTFEIVQDTPSPLLLDGLIDVSIATGEEVRVGTGPFFADPQNAGGIVFRAFDAYHRGAPSIREVSLKQYEDQRNAWAALMRGEINVLYEVSPEARDFVETESTVTVSAFLRPYTYLLAFNLGRPEFKDKRIRRALNLAIDRDEIIQTALRGHGVPAYDHLWPRHWAVDASRAAYPPDRTAALQLLKAAGRTSLHASTGDRMPSRLAFHCIVYEPLEKFAQAIQRQLALVDVDMSIELLPLTAIGPRIGTGDFDAFLLPLTNVRSLAYTYKYFHSGPAPMFPGYNAADAALDRMRLAESDDEVKAAVRVVQDVMRDDPPAIFIAYPEIARAVSRQFAIPEGPEDIFHTIARWKLAPSRTN